MAVWHLQLPSFIITAANQTNLIFKEKNVVGFDLVELCPDPAHHASDFLAAKLYYKMLSYKFNTNEGDLDEEEAFDFNQKTQEHLPKFKNDDI